MSHFYGTLKGNRGQATRQGTKRTGLTAVAASWAGCIKTYVYVDQQDRDCFVVYQDTWQGAGVRQDIARGVIGQPLDNSIQSCASYESKPANNHPSR